MNTTYKTVSIDGLNVFYREAGDGNTPTILLLHGFPTSSHMFRDLIPQLSDRFHLIAPDLPGFGLTDQPSRDEFQYTFENLTNVIEQFVNAIGLKKYAIYVFDYGAPVGFRLAARNPARITAIVSQNGNAYEEGLSAAWAPIKAYWNDANTSNREALRSFLLPETTTFQYTEGTSNPSLVSPDGRSLDDFYLSRPGNDDIQLDLFRDYRTNVETYPHFHEYFQTHSPPLLAVWGKNDPFFLPAGANAFSRDLPDADIRLFDTGHFALETHVVEISGAIREFLSKNLTEVE